MGCDIHLVVEKRANKEAPWELVTDTFPCDACDGTGERYEAKCYGCYGSGRGGFWEGRHYSLFGALDLSKSLRQAQESDDYSPWLGDHSFTHVTLAELLAYDWQGRCAKFVSRLPLLATYGEPDNVRLVFGFDS